MSVQTPLKLTKQHSNYTNTNRNKSFTHIQLLSLSLSLYIVLSVLLPHEELINADRRSLCSSEETPVCV